MGTSLGTRRLSVGGDEADAAGEALGFAIVLGATEAAMASSGVRAIVGSPYLTGKVRVGVADHVYVCGRQHMPPCLPSPIGWHMLVVLGGICSYCSAPC